MATPKSEKVAEVEDLEKRLRAASVVILTDYRGLTVSEIGALRDRLREAAVEYRVAKNTLLSLAAERAGLSALTPFLSGPTAIVLGRDDPGLPARLLQEFIRQYRKLAIKGAVVEGEPLNAEGVQSLAALPSRQELLARLIGAIQGPLSGLAFVLSGPPRALAGVLDALRARRASEGEAASGPPGPEPGLAAVTEPPETPRTEAASPNIEAGGGEAGGGEAGGAEAPSAAAGGAAPEPPDGEADSTSTPKIQEREG